MGNKEPRGSRAGRIRYEQWTGRGSNILQEAGKPQYIVYIVKDKNEEVVTDRKEVLKVWEEYFKELLNQRENSELELPSAVEGQVKLEEIGDAEVERAMKKMNRGRATGVDEVRVEMYGKEREMFTTLENTEVSDYGWKDKKDSGA